MAETTSHERAKNSAAGANGKTKVPLSGNRRLDALSTSGRATEVERSGSTSGLEAAAKRLRDAPAKQRVLQVPQQDMTAATEAMRRIGVHRTVKNMSGTKRRSI